MITMLGINNNLPEIQSERITRVLRQFQRQVDSDNVAQGTVRKVQTKGTPQWKALMIRLTKR